LESKWKWSWSVQGAIAVFLWRELGKPWKTSVALLRFEPSKYRATNLA